MAYTRTSAERKAEWAAEVERVRTMTADEFATAEAQYAADMAESQMCAKFNQERPARLRNLTAIGRALRTVREER